MSYVLNNISGSLAAYPALPIIMPKYTTEPPNQPIKGSDIKIEPINCFIFIASGLLLILCPNQPSVRLAKSRRLRLHKW